jgi:site-specific recombinase XerD
LDEEGFSSYMKEKKNSLDKINSYANRIKRFEKYLSENEAEKSIRDLTIDDLKQYVEWCKANDMNPYQELFGIRAYYHFLRIKTLAYSCNQVMQMIQLEKFNLKDFMTANQEYAKKLAKKLA